MNALLQGDYGIAPTSFQTVLLAMLLAGGPFRGQEAREMGT